MFRAKFSTPYEERWHTFAGATNERQAIMLAEIEEAKGHRYGVKFHRETLEEVKDV